MLYMPEVNFNQLLKFNGQDIIKIKITTQGRSIKILNLAQVTIPRVKIYQANISYGDLSIPCCTCIIVSAKYFLLTFSRMH